MCCHHCCNQLPFSNNHLAPLVPMDQLANQTSGLSDGVQGGESLGPKREPQTGLFRLATAGLTGVVGAFLLAVLAATLPSLIGWNSIKVLGSSMGSQLPLGSIAVTRQTPADRIHIGDVILFSASRGGIPTLHRVIRFETNDGKRVAITKGDANQQEDLTPVVMNRTGSVVQYHVPVLGFVFAFLADQATTLFFILALLLVVFMVLPQSQKKKSDTAVMSQSIKQPTRSV